MKIVVLDGSTLNPGDLSWDALKEVGEVDIYDRSTPEEVLERSQGADVLFTNKAIISADTINQLESLKYIGVMATGYNIVDIDAAGNKGIPVTNVPTYGTPAVSQMVFAHILNFTNRVEAHDLSVKAGDWSKANDFCYTIHPQQELTNQTIGIVGLGRIGGSVAQTAVSFGMNVMAYHYKYLEMVPDYIQLTGLDNIFEKCDFVTLHCPLTSDNKEFVNAELISKMKSNAFLINTARGPLVDEQALADALNAGKIAGAGLDVLSTEPPSPSNPLLSAKNCFITPHIAWATKQSRGRLMDTAVENLKSFIDGHLVNAVNESR